MSKEPVNKFEKHYFELIEKQQNSPQANVYPETIPKYWLELYATKQLVNEILSKLKTATQSEAVIASYMHQMTPAVILNLMSSGFNEGAEYVKERAAIESRARNTKAQGEHLLELQLWFYLQVMQKGRVIVLDGKKQGGWKDFKEIYITIGNRIIDELTRSTVKDFMLNNKIEDNSGVKYFLETHKNSPVSTMTEKDGILHQWLKKASKDKTVIIYSWRKTVPADGDYPEGMQKADIVWFTIQDFVQRKLY